MWKPPPMGCVSGCTYPSGLLVDRAPRRPLAICTAPERPKAQKVLLGLSEHAKTSYTYEKVRLGRFGSAGALQSAQNATLRFRPLKTPKNVVHVCQNAKVTFCENDIF